MSVNIATALNSALVRAGIPVVSVSVGEAANRATWVITYAPAATAEQKAAGEALKSTYDPATDTALVNEVASAEMDGQKMVKALALWTANRLSVAPATMRTEVLAIYKGL